MMTHRKHRHTLPNVLLESRKGKPLLLHRLATVQRLLAVLLECLAIIALLVKMLAQ